MRMVAEESKHVRNARDKLRKKLEEADKLITPEAIKCVTEEIYQWISMHVRDRVGLKDKSIALFDNNQNIAKVGPVIAKLRQDLEDRTHRESQMTTIASLQGRIRRV